MTARKLFLTVVAVSFLACVKQVPATPTRSGPPRPVQLLADTPERETSQIQQKREDVEIDTRDFERTPRVVATGETPLLRLEGARARLYGDAAGKEGFSVDNLILVEVLDEGPGLAPGSEKEIFRRFVRQRPATDRQGTGLGLAICEAVVRLHGGEIGAENRPTGGARFWFTLPLVPGAPAPEAAP